MTTPNGLPLSALQFLGVARGAVAGRASTAEFYQALKDAAATFPGDQSIPTFRAANQLRSAAVQMRNAADAFQSAPAETAITPDRIGVAPYARSLAEQAAAPIFTVGINLHLADNETGEITSQYTQVRFTGVAMTKGNLLELVQQDAEALADNYGMAYAGHDVLELVAV